MGNICNSKSNKSTNTLTSEKFLTTKKKNEFSIIKNSKLYNLLITQKNKSREMEKDFKFTTKSILNDYSSSIIFFNLIFQNDNKNPIWKINGIEWIDTPYERFILKSENFLSIFKNVINFKTIVFLSDSILEKNKCEEITDILKENKVNYKSVNFFCRGMKNFDLGFSNFDQKIANFLSEKFFLPYIVVDYKDYGSLKKKKIKTVNFAQNISFFLKNLDMKKDFNNFLRFKNVKNIILIVSSNIKELENKILKVKNEKIKLIFVDANSLIIESTKKLKKIINNSIKDKNSNSLIITESEKHLDIYYQYLKERLNLRIYYIKTYYESLFLGEKTMIKIFNSKKERSKIKRKNSNTLKSLKKYLKLYCKKYEYFEMKRISLKILENILNEPFQGKFRILKNSSKKLNEIFFQKDYGVKILFYFGFNLIEGDDEKFKTYKNSLESQEIKKIKEIFIFVMKDIGLTNNKKN